jgi:hypothetical protein
MELKIIIIIIIVVIFCCCISISGSSLYFFTQSSPSETSRSSLQSDPQSDPQSVPLSSQSKPLSSQSKPSSPNLKKNETINDKKDLKIIVQKYLDKEKILLSDRKKIQNMISSDERNKIIKDREANVIVNSSKLETIYEQSNKIQTNNNLLSDLYGKFWKEEIFKKYDIKMNIILDDNSNESQFEKIKKEYKIN